MIKKITHIVSTSLIATSFLIAFLFILSHFSLAQTSPSNLIDNGDFSKGTVSWVLQVQGDAAGTLTIKTEGNKNVAVVTVTKPHASAYFIQLLQQKLKLSANTKYLLKFKAKADSTKSIPVFSQQITTPYAQVFKEEITLSPEWKDYSFEFTVNADENAQIGFGRLAKSVGEYSFSDISLVKIP